MPYSLLVESCLITITAFKSNQGQREKQGRSRHQRVKKKLYKSLVIHIYLVFRVKFTTGGWVYCLSSCSAYYKSYINNYNPCKSNNIERFIETGFESMHQLLTLQKRFLSTSPLFHFMTVLMVLMILKKQQEDTSVCRNTHRIAITVKILILCSLCNVLF